MTDNEILASIRLKGFPSAPDLADTEIEEAIATVKRDLQYKYCLNTYGTFLTKVNQQVYDLFNSVSDPTTSQGVFPNGLAVIELVWSPVAGEDDLSLFGIAPFLVGQSILPGDISVYSFNTPSDW